MAPIEGAAYHQRMVDNVIHVAEGQEPSDAGAWVVVRRVGDQFRVAVNDPSAANPLTLRDGLRSFTTAIFHAEGYAKKLGVPVHAVGCENA